MAFLSKLGKIINQQFGTGQSESTNFDKFSQNIDRTNMSQYVEDGFIRDIRPNRRSVLHQQPDVYIVVKKKMFSSLLENYKTELLEEQERLVLSASKKLFQNKCKLLSLYEKLTKIEKITVESDRFNTFLGPYFINLIDSSAALGLFELDDDTKSAINQLRNVLSYSDVSDTTTWTTNDWDSVFSNKNGDGTGTFELTLVSSCTTNCENEWGKGSASLTIEDPYNILSITEADIDQALSDVTNPLRSNKVYKFTEQEIQKQIDDLTNELSIERKQREASQIIFKISSGTLTSNRVRAILDSGQEIVFQYTTGLQDALEDIENNYSVMTTLESIFSTGSVYIDPMFIRGNEVKNISQNDQLSPSELKKFVQIISDTFTLLDQGKTSQGELQTQNSAINYARNRMRLLFNGKYMLQPLDDVDIFINSRTSEDERLPGGYQYQIKNKAERKFDTILKNIDHQIMDLKSISGKSLSFDDIERISTVGPTFPKWLWRQFKQDITGQPTGPCVFSGLVKSVKGEFSDGKNRVDVSCTDNCEYFNLGVINFQPSTEVFDSEIYDPLTPFDLSFDAATGVAITDVNAGEFPPLLPENQTLLLSGITTFKNGPEKGTPATLEKLQKTTKEVVFNQMRDVLHNPDGMVYRWKQGIQTLTKDGRPYPRTSIEQEKGILLTNQPFAGQDVMNVISLLITGQPYNYSTFLKAAIQNGNSLGTDRVSNVSTYIQGIVSDIEKRNVLWGNFIPHKQLVINQNTNKLLTEAVTANSTLAQKLKERAKLQDDLTIQQIGSTDPLSSISVGVDGQTSANSSIDMLKVSNLQQQLANLNVQIEALQQQLQKTIDNNPDIGIVGNDVVENTSSSNYSQQQKDKNDLRRNLSRFTARRFWQVKANEDKNLFIVDDQYDTNYDIMAFERGIGKNIELFNSQYGNISSQINTVKNLLGLEVFATSQGHIIARPPGYNKVPYSVFKKMMKDKNTKGIKVFPEFLESLYKNQINGTISQIEIIEDEIRLRAVALGAKNDQDIISILTKGDGTALVSDSFMFLTQFPPGSSTIGTKAFSQLFSMSDEEYTGNQSVALERLGYFETKINNILKSKRLFDNGIQADVYYSYLNVSPESQIDIIEQIRQRLKIKTGNEAVTLSQLFGNDQFKRVLNGNAVSQTDRINIFGQISRYVSERQILLKSLAGSIRNLRDGINSTNATDWDEIPETLEHMIEYEDEDDIGPNSGRRFILSPDRILSFSMSENPPPYTMVTVNGLFGEGFVRPGDSFKTSNDGNAITSAYAVDYDMWYQYGFKASQAIQAPFFSDKDTQCAPFAVSNLIKCRENILQATCSVAGYNEFYQPGDVVYVEHKGLLFYVTGVHHSISYGKQLTTQLTLSYGHNPGEYIPTMLDVVGKIMYNSKRLKIRNERRDMVGLAKSIGAIAVEAISTAVDDETVASDMNSLLKGRFGNRNKNVLSNALFSISGLLNQKAYQNKKTYVKIVFYTTSTSDVVKMNNLTNNIANWLVYPEQYTPEGLSSLNLNSQQQKTFGINSSDIIIEAMDLDTHERVRLSPDNNIGTIQSKQGPSSAAINLARHLVYSDVTPSKLKETLANGVIDIFIDYETITSTVSESSGTSQAEQSANETIDTAKSSLASKYV